MCTLISSSDGWLVGNSVVVFGGKVAVSRTNGH